jgi:hypothetical protein
MDRYRTSAVRTLGYTVIHKPSLAAGLATCVLVVVGVAGCGGGGTSGVQLRDTVHRYLDATTAGERCQLLTTVYRTENPSVLFSGGCRQSEQISAAAEAARRRLRITKVDIRGDQATVSLGSSSSSSLVARESAGGELTGLFLSTEAGQWRIDGFSASASATASAG